MASIQARHSRRCALGRPWTTFEEATAGCTCTPGPMYHVAARIDGKLVREPVGHNRKNAERALRKIGSEIDEDRYVAPKNVRFNEWADTWLRDVLKRPGRNTRASYVSTLAYAKRAFGTKHVRRVDQRDVDMMLGLMRKRSPSTQRKHLRVLQACLSAAVRRGYAARNVVALLGEDERPPMDDREAAYFEDAELVRLLAELPEGLPRTAVKVALGTGLRKGELLALRWRHVDLLGGRLRVRESYVGRKDDRGEWIAFTEPKSAKSKRDVYISGQVAAVLAGWEAETGRPGEEALVFPGFNRDGVLTPDLLNGWLYAAMTRAGVPRKQPDTGEQRTWHSLRHSYAKIALEHGRSLKWLSEQMGHSSIAVTDKTYSHIERKVREQQAQQLEGAFPF